MVTRENFNKKQNMNSLYKQLTRGPRRANIALTDNTVTRSQIRQLNEFDDIEDFGGPVAPNNTTYHKSKVVYVIKSGTSSEEGDIESPFKTIEDAVLELDNSKTQYNNFMICILDNERYELDIPLVLPKHTTLMGTNATIDGYIVMENDDTHINIKRHICTDKFEDHDEYSLVRFDADNISYKVGNISSQEAPCFVVDSQAGIVSINFDVCQIASPNAVLDIVGEPSNAVVNIVGDKVLSVGSTDLFIITNTIERCKISIDLNVVLINKPDNIESNVILFRKYDEIPGSNNLLTFTCNDVKILHGDINASINAVEDIDNINTDGNNINVIWNVIDKDETVHSNATVKGNLIVIS